MTRFDCFGPAGSRGNIITGQGRSMTAGVDVVRRLGLNLPARGETSIYPNLKPQASTLASDVSITSQEDWEALTRYWTSSPLPFFTTVWEQLSVLH